VRYKNIKTGLRQGNYEVLSWNPLVRWVVSWFISWTWWCYFEFSK